MIPRRLDDADVKALYLLLLARLPEAERIYNDNRGRPAAELIAETLRSSEFRERILGPLLAQNGLPHDRLDYAEFGFARAWLERSGMGRAGAAAGWDELLAIFLTAPPAAQLLPRFLPGEAARLALTAAEIRRLRQPAQPPADDADVKALYLLLLGRMPQNAAAYRDNKGRSRDDLVADLLATAEFRERIAAPLLLDLPIPQQRLDPSDLDFMRAWMTGVGLPPEAIDADWADLFAAFLLAANVAGLIARILPACADRLQQAARRLQARGAGRLPLSDRDIEALYLLLLARRPESEVVYRDRRGRRRDRLIVDILGSGEFSGGVVQHLLSAGSLLQERLGSAELAAAWAWVEAIGVPLPGGGKDWARLLAGFVTAEPVALLFRQSLPEQAEQLAQRLEDLARATGDRRLRADLNALDARLKELEAGWKQHVPAFLNAVSSVGAFAHEQARLARDVNALRSQLDTASKAAN